MMTGTSKITLAARRASGADLAIIAGIELGGALLLGFFLLTDDWRLIVALLAVFAAGFALLQIRPAIEDRIVSAFHAARAQALGLGAVVVLVYPFMMQGSSYALHLLVIAQLYAVLALALNFQLGSANIPNFATGASYGIGAYCSALLAIDFGVSFWLTLPIAALVGTGTSVCWLQRERVWARAVLAIAVNRRATRLALWAPKGRSNRKIRR